MKGLKVIVCGGREFDDGPRVFAVLDRFHAAFGISMLVAGAQRGADALAGQWAIEHDVPFLRVPALFSTLGKAAGPERNARMIALCAPDRVIAFPGGVGTQNMCTQAETADVEVIRIPPRKEEP